MISIAKIYVLLLARVIRDREVIIRWPAYTVYNVLHDLRCYGPKMHFLQLSLIIWLFLKMTCNNVSIFVVCHSLKCWLRRPKESLTLKQSLKISHLIMHFASHNLNFYFHLCTNVNSLDTFSFKNIAIVVIFVSQIFFKWNVMSPKAKSLFLEENLVIFKFSSLQDYYL